jgi:hypothetical protein
MRCGNMCWRVSFKPQSRITSGSSYLLTFLRFARAALSCFRVTNVRSRGMVQQYIIATAADAG